MSSYATNGGSPSRSNSNRREKIIIGFDPVVVKLDGPPEGIQREGQYGVDYQYFCDSDAATFYLPKAGRDAIIESGARAGDTIELCKSQRGRVVTYVCMLVSAQQQQQQPAPVPVPVRQQAQQAVRASAISQCLRVAIDDLLDAQQYAASKGLALDAPNFEDARCIALTYFIQRSKS